MDDSSGPIPFPKSAVDALREIRKIARDKRSHVMLDDCLSWMELKMKIIDRLVMRGLRASKARRK